MLTESLDEQAEVVETSTENEESLNTETNEDDFHDEDVVYVDGDTPPEQEENNEETVAAPSWVKELRAKHKEQRAEIHKLQEELAKTRNVAQVAQTKISPKPKIEDFDYDTELYENALDSWYNEQQVAKQQEIMKQKEAEKQQQEVSTVMQKYAAKKQELKVPDYDLAEDSVSKNLSIDQQNVILKYASNPALVVYALGKNKSKVDEFSSIKDPILFAMQIKEFEGKLKIEKKRPSTAPERIIQSSGVKLSNDMHLEALRKEAEKTGDYSKVYKYKKELKG